MYGQVGFYWILNRNFYAKKSFLYLNTFNPVVCLFNRVMPIKNYLTYLRLGKSLK